MKLTKPQFNLLGSIHRVTEKGDRLFIIGPGDTRVANTLVELGLVELDERMHAATTPTGRELFLDLQLCNSIEQPADDPDLDWTDEQLAAAGIPKGRLSRLVRMLRKCSMEMRAMGLHVYGASGTGHLVHSSRPTHVDEPGRTSGKPDMGSSVASVGQGFDGGDW